jgi:hypothetical protein
MEQLAADPDREEPPTLANVRSALRHSAHAPERLDERLHPRTSATALDELDRLIEEFGPEALAIDFIAVKASEPLSRVIEAVLGDARVRRRATLGMVRDEMIGGLTARLVGDGVIEPDEDQTLLEEIDGLIERHGPDTLAEEFIRLE